MRIAETVIVLFALMVTLTARQACADHYGRIFGSEVVADQTILIDPLDASWTQVGIDGIGFSGLDFDAVHGRLFGSDTSADLYTIDVETGAPTLVGNIDILHGYGLAYIPSMDRLIVSDFPGNIHRVNPDNGRSRRIGRVGGGAFGNIDGLAFDPVTETLYGISEDAQALLVIDPDTADAVPIDVDLPEDQWCGLTFDVDRGVLYATSVTPTRLYEIDPVKGTTTYLGTLSGASAVHGLAYIPLPQRTVAQITDINVLVGQLLSGDEGHLLESDNVRMKIRGKFLPNGSPPYQMIMEATLVTEAADALWVDIMFESKMSEAGGTVKVYMKNWTTGKFKLVKKVAIGKSDQTIIRTELDASRYVRGNGMIKVRVLHQKPLTDSGNPFRSFLDLLEVGVWK